MADYDYETEEQDPKIKLEKTKFAIQQLVQRIKDRTGIDPDTFIVESPKPDEDFFRKINKAAYEKLSDFEKCLVLLIYGVEESARGEEFFQERHPWPNDYWRGLSFSRSLDSSGGYNGVVDGVETGTMAYNSGIPINSLKKLSLTEDEIASIKTLIGFDPESGQEEDNFEIGGYSRLYSGGNAPYFSTAIPSLLVEDSPDNKWVQFTVHQYNISGFIDDASSSGTQSGGTLVPTRDPAIRQYFDEQRSIHQQSSMSKAELDQSDEADETIAG